MCWLTRCGFHGKFFYLVVYCLVNSAQLGDFLHCGGILGNLGGRLFIRAFIIAGYGDFGIKGAVKAGLPLRHVIQGANHRKLS